MADPVLIVQNVFKRYRIGQRQPYYALRDGITHMMKQVLHGKLLAAKPRQKEFYALTDVSFSMKKGDVLGIIGPNGAGKSTLLKILSKITLPTQGDVILRGRVSSLLEVGTGFHPELTGRENIFLNGAILGMTAKEIRRKFDDIVAFSEIEEFLDTPVKHYSSGMYMRLAFAVAAHLESEILLIDEVLAVGDVAFQKKCLGKMEEIGREGRTVIFVSHNMAAVERLCPKAIYLNKGKVMAVGSTNEIVQKYLQTIKEAVYQLVSMRTDRVGAGKIVMTDAVFTNTRSPSSYAAGDDIQLEVQVRSDYRYATKVRLSLSVFTENQQGLITCDSLQKNKTYVVPSGKSVIHCRLSEPPLNYGVYHINMAIFRDNEPEDWVSSLARFTVDSGTFDDMILEKRFNPILVKYEWNVTA